MTEILKFKGPKRRRLTSLLGLALDGSRLEGVVVRRTNGSVQVQQSFSATLSLDPLTADPDLVGREILNHLHAAGVRERHCAVSVPLKWALTAHTEMPDLPEADVPGFLQLEAERGFPSDVETLHYSTSRCRLPSGTERVTLVGLPRTNIALLEKVLRAARLKPVNFSIGIAALQSPADKRSDGVLALAIGETHVALQITCGGGIAALRAFEGAIELEGVQKVLRAEIVARESRITLGQLPEELRDTIRRVRIFGPEDLAHQLADEVAPRLEPLGLVVERVKSYPADEFRVQLPPEAPVSRAFSLAVRVLTEGAPQLEFLPPKVTALQQFARRYSSGKLRLAGAAAVLLLVIVAAAFGVQQWQLTRLESEWKRMQTEVGELQVLQHQIRQYRPWYENTPRGLQILRELTSAFPEDNSVSAKTVEIRDLNAVVCSGVARDNSALLGTLDRLRATGSVADLKVSQIRGRAPALQFTFDFRWNEGGTREN